jgi:hypothetical protein
LDLSTTKGAAQQTATLNVVNAATTQTWYFGRWISDLIDTSVTTQIDEQTWTWGIAVSESSTSANFIPPMGCAYVMTSGGTKRGGGSIFDSVQTGATGAVEASITEDGQVVTVGVAFSNAVTGLAAGDRVVVEFWGGGSITMAGAYTVSFYYDGATDVVDATTTDAASYIETPQNITFGAAAAADIPDIVMAPPR